MKPLRFICSAYRRVSYSLRYSDRLTRWLFCAACVKYLVGT